MEPPLGGLCAPNPSVIANDDEDEEEDVFPPTLKAALDAADVIMQLLVPLPDIPDDLLNAPDILSLNSFLTAWLPKYLSNESDRSELCCCPPLPLLPPPACRLDSGSISGCASISSSSADESTPPPPPLLADVVVSITGVSTMYTESEIEVDDESTADLRCGVHDPSVARGDSSPSPPPPSLLSDSTVRITSP